jgi:hypothetical protein
VVIAAGETFMWFSDGSNTHGGFVICASHVSLLAPPANPPTCSTYAALVTRSDGHGKRYGICKKTSPTLRVCRFKLRLSRLGLCWILPHDK